MRTARRPGRNATVNLAQAMAMLIQNQAIFLENMSKMKLELDEIKTILLRHERILNELPEAVQRKIGFKAR